MAYVSSNELPKKFEVIIYGTGLTESIISAALSRNGMSVLHIDANHFYGGEWGSLMYREFMDFCEQIISTPPTSQTSIDPEPSDPTSHRYFLRSTPSALYQNVVQECVEAPVADATESILLQDKVQITETAVDSSALVGATAVTTATDITDKDNDVTTEVSIETANHQINTQDIKEEVSEHIQDSETLSNQPSDNQNVIQSDPNQASPDQTQPPSGNSQTLEQEDNAATPSTPPSALPIPIVESFPPPDTPLLSWTELKSQYRMFTFDLWPKLIYATDPFVDMLIKSTVTKYLEFKAVNKIITVLNHELSPVPASRADVFTSKTVSVLEKRLLMRFVNFVMDMDKNEAEVEKFKGRPFSQLLEHMSLNAKLCGLIQSSIAQVDSDALTETALERSKFYLQSIGRYSNSPYLWPVYGIGELPQAFCRLSAVFGGVYMLRKEILYLEIVESDGVNKCCSIRDNESTTFNCNHVIIGASYIPDISPTIRYSRAILAINRKLAPTHCPDVRSDVGFITVPSHTLGPEQLHTIKIIELSPNSQSTPEKCYLVHLTCLAHLTAREDLFPAVNFLFHNTSDLTDSPPKPKVLYALYYNYSSTQAPTDNRSHIAENVHLISSPDTEPSYQRILSDAKGVFHRICPGDDFLPPPPDPEDIVYESPSPEPTQGGEGDEGDRPADALSEDTTEKSQGYSDDK